MENDRASVAALVIFYAISKMDSHIRAWMDTSEKRRSSIADIKARHNGDTLAN